MITMFPTFGSSNIPSSFTSNANNMNLTFGQPTNTAPTFGQLGASSFGTSQNMSSPFARPSSSFGQTVNNDQLKATLFGNATNLFGNSSNYLFGQQNPIKSSNQMETTNQNSAIKMFENTSKDQVGTPLKFKPTKDTESLFKGGLNHNLTIAYQSLTCMKEYESKSFEELRLEDYQLNRKGSQLAYVVNNPQNNTFFNNPSTSANTVTSQPDCVSIFGQSSGTGFSQNMFNNPLKNTHGGIFINPSSSFGTNAVTKSNSPFNTNVQSSNLFQSNTNTQLPFPPQNTFGQLGFGNQNTFGSNQPNQNVGNQSIGNPNIGNQNIGNQNMGNQNIGNQNTGLFGQNTSFYNQNKPPSFKFPSPLGTNTTTSQLNQLPVLFSSTTTTAPSLNQSVFGQSNQGKLNLPTNNSSPFFAQRQKLNSIGSFPSSVGNNESKLNNIFNNQTNRFGTFPNTSFGIPRNSFQDIQVNQNQSNGPEQIRNMLISPYGATNLLNNISSTEPDINNLKKITNPGELESVLKNIEKTKSTKNKSVNTFSIFERKDSVFHGLEYYDEKLVANTRVNNNPKRLFIRNNKNNLSNTLIESPTISNDTITESENPGYQNNEQNVSNTQTDNEMYDKAIQSNYSNAISDNNEEIQYERTSHPIFAETIENNLTTTTDLSERHVQYPVGITLTRPEYYTVPPVKELNKYVNKDGSCFVQGFTIGRYGYGNVYFPETFDVSNLNLDELVHFRNKEITIYPDDDTRPPVGEGLNRRAQITLDRVWPRDKITKVLITDVDTLLKIDYAKKLRTLCEKQGTRYVEYRPDTGSWVFYVDHF